MKTRIGKLNGPRYIMKYSRLVGIFMLLSCWYLEPKKVAKPRVIHIEKPSKEQKLLRKALQISERPSLTREPMKRDETRRSRGELVDFIDEEEADRVSQFDHRNINETLLNYIGEKMEKRTEGSKSKSRVE